LAAAYTDLGEHVKAAHAWQNCYQSNPMGENAWLAAVRIGNSLLKAGQREQASKWLQQAKLIVPDGDGVDEIEALESALR
jgi:hypothetical protein